MSLFFWVHVLLGEVCAVSWGRAYVLCAYVLCCCFSFLVSCVSVVLLI